MTSENTSKRDHLESIAQSLQLIEKHFAVLAANAVYQNDRRRSSDFQAFLENFVAGRWPEDV